MRDGREGIVGSNACAACPMRNTPTITRCAKIMILILFGRILCIAALCNGSIIVELVDCRLHARGRSNKMLPLCIVLIPKYGIDFHSLTARSWHC